MRWDGSRDPKVRLVPRGPRSIHREVSMSPHRARLLGAVMAFAATPLLPGPSWAGRLRDTGVPAAQAPAAQGVVGPARPARQDPIPEGRRIEAQDGDIIVVEGSDRVRIARRSEAVVRIVAEMSKGFVLVLADYSDAAAPPDGFVDAAFSLTSVEGEWPLDARWEGAVSIEELTIVGDMAAGALLLTTPQGIIQFVPFDRAQPAADAAATIRFRGIGRSGSSLAGPARGQPFDEAERWHLQMAERNASMQRGRPGTAMAIGAEVSVTSPTAGGPSSPTASMGPASGAVRVGGNVPPPRKLHHVDPVYPEGAAKAGLMGVVIAEVEIAADGSVANARVLRSIPLLDRAALDAIRQWRFEPTVVMGRAVPVILTVTVPFER
jgi:TonB family protein